MGLVLLLPLADGGKGECQCAQSKSAILANQEGLATNFSGEEFLDTQIFGICCHYQNTGTVIGLLQKFAISPTKYFLQFRCLCGGTQPTFGGPVTYQIYFISFSPVSEKAENEVTKEETVKDVTLADSKETEGKGMISILCTFLQEDCKSVNT